VQAHLESVPLKQTIGTTP